MAEVQSVNNLLNENLIKAEVQGVNKLLGMNLNIPNYQRPYKWDVKNIRELISDIEEVIKNFGQYKGNSKNFKYRIGTVILYSPPKKEILEIVDGQQRIISLLLIKKCLGEDFPSWIIGKAFTNKISQLNIHRNYEFIDDYFSLKSKEVKEDFKRVIDNTLQVVVITVGNLGEAFQLFDSQNSRGKSLDPHDILKAYHLREMRELPYEMMDAVTKWEEKNPEKIKDLFESYLFPILNWSRDNSTKAFTIKEIDTYKGISESSPYTYARRTNKAMPYFQIGESFTSGYDFFIMVDHYIGLLKIIDQEIFNNGSFQTIEDVLSNKRTLEKPSDLENVKFQSAGFQYAKKLFYCALLFYYDKFHNFEEVVVKKLFSWAFMLRVDRHRLGFDSVNKYAIGEGAECTNKIKMFLEIDRARMHYDIASIQVKLSDKRLKESSNSEENGKNFLKEVREELYDTLNKIKSTGERNE